MNSASTSFRSRHFAKARPRHVRGQMNRLEAAYAQHLELLKRAGEIEDYKFEAVTLTVAEPQVAKVSRLTPDFLVIAKDMTVELHDTKAGPVEEDSWLKLKMLSDAYPFRVVMVRKDGSGWKLEEV